MTVLLGISQSWHCPACGGRATTRKPERNRFHRCPKLGVYAPMQPEGTKAKVTVNEWGDYVGRELVQFSDHGRPLSSLTVERDTGQDAVVFAPTAQADTT